MGHFIHMPDNPKGGKKGFVDVWSYSTAPPAWTRSGDSILGEDGGDRAGEVSISWNGELVLIGSKHSSTGPGFRSGQARLFRFQSGAWQRIGLVDGEAVDDKSGWTVALNAYADATEPTPSGRSAPSCVIGAPFNNGQGADSGHARVYEYDPQYPSTGLQQVGADIDGDGDSLVQGDASVSLSENGATVAIGASYKDGAGGKAGHVNVYSEGEESRSRCVSTLV